MLLTIEVSEEIVGRMVQDRWLDYASCDDQREIERAASRLFDRYSQGRRE